MKHYAIAALTITDPTWVRDYVAEVTPLVESYGGRYLARTDQVETIEGAPLTADVMLVIEWPSREAALAFYDATEYDAQRTRRTAGSHGPFVLIPAQDGAARPPATAAG